MKTNVYNQKAEKVGTMDLPKGIFELKINKDLVHQATVAQMGNERQVSAHTKTKAEVRGGGKKPWAQKGTGRARSGSSRSPIWIGGGVTFGPRSDRNFKKDINKKMKQKAASMVLSDKVANNSLAVLDELKINEYKTKEFNKIVGAFGKTVFLKEDKKPRKANTLIIVNEKDEKAKYSSRNIKDIKLISLNNINILDLLKYKSLIITKEAILKLEKK
ncbi:MAG: 50S ribosomal protein L4 [bacterium]